VGQCTLIRSYWNIFDLSHVPVTDDAARVPKNLWNDCSCLCEASKETVRLNTLIQRITMVVTQSYNLVGPVNVKGDNSGRPY